jgi:hypothetical protein
VNWNTKDYLLQCIDSLFDQKERHQYEIIVVDNGSSDGSQQSVAETYPAVQLIQNKRNLGFSKANNIGIAAATGDYVCIVNSDIKVQGGINDMVDFLENGRDVGLIGPKTLNSDLSLRMNCRRFPSLWKCLCSALGLNRLFPDSPWFNDTLMTEFPHDTIREVDVLPGCFLMARREALSQVGLLDEQFFIYGEDKDWCRRFWQKDWKVVFYPHAEVIHFAKVSSSKQPTRFAVEKLKANYQYWRKHHGFLKRKTFLAIMTLHHFIRFSVWILVYLLENSNRASTGGCIRSNYSCLKLSISSLIRMKI